MTQSDPGPAVQRILLGANLRDAREACGLSTADATKALGWYAGKLSKIEQGDLLVSSKDLGIAVKIYSIGQEIEQRLHALASEARRKLPPSRVPEWAAKYVSLVRAAAELKIFYGDTFPGTVQTADYARAILTRSVTVSPAEVDRMVDERVQRAQRITSTESTRLWLVVGEEALHRQIGGPETLRGQLEHIIKLAESSRVHVQVLPFEAGAHSVHGVTFTIVTLIEGRPGLVYVEGLTGSDYLGREHLHVYTLAFDNLRAAALSPEATLSLIRRRITEL
ncbi:MAG TPA: helix-turn-helix transcriptional regulator [Actinokineospora sp.]|jgi:hypothetical protein|nr:helix-turn-helix transcriptional regulator [Actinokineospora sp.]